MPGPKRKEKLKRTNEKDKSEKKERDAPQNQRAKMPKSQDLKGKK